MLPDVEKLLILQERDRKIRQLKQELTRAPAERKALDARQAGAEAALEASKQKTRELELEKKKLELDAQSRRDNIGKYKAQQFQTRKNEEFQALGNEIKRFEGEIQSIEDRELDVMEEIDRLKPVIANSEREFAETKTQVQGLIGDLDGKTKAIQDQIKELEASRQQLTEGLDEDLVDTYEHLFHGKGDAVVGLEHGVCTGCHMKVTVQTVTRVKGDREIVSCEQCGRILYFVE